MYISSVIILKNGNTESSFKLIFSITRRIAQNWLIKRYITKMYAIAIASVSAIVPETHPFIMETNVNL